MNDVIVADGQRRRQKRYDLDDTMAAHNARFVWEQMRLRMYRPLSGLVGDDAEEVRQTLSRLRELFERAAR